MEIVWSSSFIVVLPDRPSSEGTRTVEKKKTTTQSSVYYYHLTGQTGQCFIHFCVVLLKWNGKRWRREEMRWRRGEGPQSLHPQTAAHDMIFRPAGPSFGRSEHMQARYHDHSPHFLSSCSHSQHGDRPALVQTRAPHSESQQWDRRQGFSPRATPERDLSGKGRELHAVLSLELSSVHPEKQEPLLG